MTTETREQQLRVALLALLDAVDYTNGACLMTEFIGAVLPVALIKNAREALKPERVERAPLSDVDIAHGGKYLEPFDRGRR